MKLGIATCTLAAVSLVLASTVLVADDEKAGNEADERQVLQVMIDAGIDETWAAVSTKTGWESWAAPLVDMDFRVGGLVRSTYDPDAKIGDPGTIENRILSYDPGRMLSLQVVKAPEGFPFPNAIKEMWTVMYFEQLSAGRTKVTLVGLGYTDTEESLKMKDFFAMGNTQVLGNLKRVLEEKD